MPNTNLKAGTKCIYHPPEVRKSSAHGDLWLTHFKTSRAGRDSKIIPPKALILLTMHGGSGWEETTPKSGRSLFKNCILPFPVSFSLLPAQIGPVNFSTLRHEHWLLTSACGFVIRTSFFLLCPPQSVFVCSFLCSLFCCQPFIEHYYGPKDSTD